jgi:hypothetical protein
VDHQRGKDPTPQGRRPTTGPQQHSETPPEGYESEKYENSAPGPAVRQDGAYFFGYKRENAQQPERSDHV